MSKSKDWKALAPAGFGLQKAIEQADEVFDKGMAEASDVVLNSGRTPKDLKTFEEALARLQEAYDEAMAKAGESYTETLRKELHIE